MRYHQHQLLDHPMFDERPFKDILEPFGFEVSVKTEEAPIDPEFDDPAAINAYAEDPQGFIAATPLPHPPGFTEVDRSENDDGEIYSVAVRAKTVFAQLLLCADSVFAGPSSPYNNSYIDIYRERMRQLSTEGFDREHDDQWSDGQIADAAASYAGIAATAIKDGKTDSSRLSTSRWPWAKKWWKPTNPRRDLVKAGALILAEIERLDRAASTCQNGGTCGDPICEPREGEQ